MRRGELKMCNMGFVLPAVGALMALGGAASAQAPYRVTANQKGSLLIFSKVEIKWSADGRLIQDTVVDLANDFPEDVSIQAFFINGDTEVHERCGGDPCHDNIIEEYEPGWNTADCRFELTAEQPHFWSAAGGSDKCQPFTVLDDEGPGRPDPRAGMTTRVLRGYALFFAVDFVHGVGATGRWLPIRWNHLHGDAVVINYENGTAWEYSPWGFQAHGQPHGMPMSGGEFLHLDGISYDIPFDTLLLDFYATGATAFSGGEQTVMTDTDLTVHVVSADLRQDNCGPILTKVEAEIWNEFETKFSGTRRCICCWDQTPLGDWVRSGAIPNHFKRSALRTDKGKARLDGVASIECEYKELCGEVASRRRRGGDCDPGVVAGAIANESEDAALLGLSTKFLAFTPSGALATAGSVLVGAGEEPAVIRLDVQEGPDELLNPEGRAGRTRGKTEGSKGLPTGRGETSRNTAGGPGE